MSHRLRRGLVSGGVLTALAAAWTTLCWFLTELLANVALRVVAAQDGLVEGYRSALLLSWRTAAAGLLLLVAIVFAVAVIRGARVRRLPRWPFALGLVVLLALATGLGPVGQVYFQESLPRQQNRWGFCPIFAPGSTQRLDLGWEGFPPMEVRVNDEGYRDDDWTIPAPEDGTRRVVLVGDSHVWGHGIPDASGLLDRHLEQALKREGGAPWDVWNVALAPAAFWYYAAAIERAVPAARARYAVASIYPTDVSFLDEQRAMADKGDFFCSLAYQFGLMSDLLWMVHHVTFPKGNDFASDPAVQEANRAWFEQLVAFVERSGITLVIWQPMGAVELLKPWHGRPGLVFLDWRSAFGTHCTEMECNWQEDPTLAYPDGHPLASTNARVAEVIARTILELEAQRPAVR
jgi:hypothetical protein